MTIKSLLTASVLGVIGAAVSTTAFANVNTSTFCKPGFYAGIQGGASETFYHPDQIFSPIAGTGNGSSSSAFTGAPLPAILTSAQVLTEHFQTSTTTSSTLSRESVDSRGLGGRIYAGYQFNPYFAIEAGYTQYGKTSFHALGTTVTQFNEFGYVPEGIIPTGVINPQQDRIIQTDTINQTTTTHTAYSGDLTEHAIDLVGKATLPLQYGFGVYLKAGMAYITANRYINARTLDSNFTRTYTQWTPDGGTALLGRTTTITTNGSSNVQTASTVYDKTYQAFRPVAGVGINYSIPNTAMSVNADYTRVFSSGGIDNAKLLSLGLEYKFA